MSDWKQYTIDCVISLAIPAGTKVRLGDGGTMVVLTLPGDPATDILLGLFPVNGGGIVSASVMQSRLADFMDQCVRGVVRVKGMSIEPAAEVDDPNLTAWQAVAEIEGEDRWWLARLYGRLQGNDVLLVHWNGPAEQMKRVVLRSFASIKPLFAIC